MVFPFSWIKMANTAHSQKTDTIVKLHKFEDDFTLFICDRCKRHCALLTKETHKPILCPFLEFEKNNSLYIFKF